MVLSPLPPLANRLWRRGWTRTRTGARVPVTYKTTEAKAWQSAMAWLIRASGWDSAWRRTIVPEAGDLIVEVWLFFPDRRLRDADGPIKLLLDTLADALGINDVRCLPQVKGREVDRVRPRIEVRIGRAAT